MASTADIMGVYIAVDITAATDTAITAITVPMGIMAITIVRTDIMAIGDTATMGAIGDTDIMGAIGPIADTGRGVHIVDGADCRPFKRVHSAELMKA